MSREALKKMIQKLEEIGDLGVVRGRGSKRILSETVEEVSFEFGSQYSAWNARAVLRD